MVTAIVQAGKMMAWTRVATVKLERGHELGDLFCSYERQGFLANWMWYVRINSSGPGFWPRQLSACCCHFWGGRGGTGLKEKQEFQFKHTKVQTSSKQTSRDDGQVAGEMDLKLKGESDPGDLKHGK